MRGILSTIALLALLGSTSTLSACYHMRHHRSCCASCDCHKKDCCKHDCGKDEGCEVREGKSQDKK